MKRRNDVWPRLDNPEDTKRKVPFNLVHSHFFSTEVFNKKKTVSVHTKFGH
jgi:hypothetical protein